MTEYLRRKEAGSEMWPDTYFRPGNEPYTGQQLQQLIRLTTSGVIPNVTLTEIH
jgi:hypothetical protein